MEEKKIRVGIMGLQFGLRHMEGAMENGYETIATGHYARIEFDEK